MVGKFRSRRGKTIQGSCIHRIFDLAKAKVGKGICILNLLMICESLQKQEVWLPSLHKEHLEKQFKQTASDYHVPGPQPH
jgi:hypothetical protein